jgi:surface-adhesin protein E
MPRLRSNAAGGMVCVALLSAAAPAEARELRAVLAPSHDPLFVDYATVKRSGAEVAFHYVLNVPVALDAPAATRRWRSNEMEAVIDCNKGTFSVGKVVAHSGPGATGNIVGSHSPTPAERKPAHITPGGTFDFLARHLCSPKR